MKIKELIKATYGIIPGKKHAYVLLKNIWRPPERIYRHLHFHGIFKVQVDPDRHFLMRHYGYQIENEIFWCGLTGAWEKTSMALWIQLSAMSKYIFDVGANTGVYALVAQCVNPTARVFAFEPVKRVYTKLVENCRLNNYNIVCSEVGLSDEDGNAIIYDTADAHTLSVTVNKNMLPGSADVLTTPIVINRLSSFLEKNKIDGVDLLKIDVETHEPEVLTGLGPYLEKFKPTLLVEVLTDEIGQRIEAIVKGHNYLYFNIDEEGRVIKTDTIHKSLGYNYLICQPVIAQRLDWGNFQA